MREETGIQRGRLVIALFRAYYSGASEFLYALISERGGQSACSHPKTKKWEDYPIPLPQPLSQSPVLKCGQPEF